jgi:glycolate oxidase iron-sulfur subunit
MQTNFTDQQLADPDIRASNEILRKCVHCGFCTATCPTYVLLGDELDSPRGRIYLIKDMLESGEPASARVVKHVDRCLSCLSCMTTCPASVNYMHLVDHARAHIQKTYRRPVLDRVIRWVIAAVLPDPHRFYASLRLAALARPLAPLFRLVPALKPIAAMLALAPRIDSEVQSGGTHNVHPATGGPSARVALLTGCVQPVLAPHINAATIRLFNRLGAEVVTPPSQGCCGALVHHMGREATAHDAAKRNIDAWMAEIDGEGLDAIIINASGCGTTVKDYAHMLREDAAYAEKAKRISHLASDVTEVLDTLNIKPSVSLPKITVAYHSACSLQHGQQIHELPKRLLANAGFDVVDIPEGHLCCGSAGVYNVLQPDIATRLRDRKVENIGRVAPDIVAAGNIGCITQIAAGTDTPVVHTVELLDWVTGGPEPRALAGKLGQHSTA